MARSTVITATEEQIAAEVSEQLAAREIDKRNTPVQWRDESEDDDFSLTNVLAELGSDAQDAKVNVFLMEPGKPSAFVDTFNPADFSLETLKQLYGPGMYKIQLRANGRIIPGGRNVRIAKSLVPAVPGHIPAPQFQPDKLIETMQAGFGQLANMFTQALDRMASLQPKQKTNMETLQELQLMREIMGGNQPQAASNPVDVFNLALELAGKINPAPADDNSLLMEGLKQLGPILSAGMNPANVQVKPRTFPAQAPTQAPIQAPIQAPAQLSAMEIPANPGQIKSPVSTEQDTQTMMINVYLHTLVANAKADNDPMTYASAILDFIGDAEAVKLANAPDWFSMLCRRVPDAANYREWFEELRQGILTLTIPDESDKQGNNDTSQAPIDVAEQPAAKAT